MKINEAALTSAFMHKCFYAKSRRENFIIKTLLPLRGEKF
jgi:hypothetical protein